MDEIGGGRGSRGGPQRGVTADPYANLQVVRAPSNQPTSLPQPITPPRPAAKTTANPASNQVAQQEAASARLAADLQAAQEKAKSTAPVATQQAPVRPAAAPQAGTGPAPLGQGFTLPPEDAWLAKIGINVDTWLDLDPRERMVLLLTSGASQAQAPSVAKAIDQVAMRRTGRPLVPAETLNLAPSGNVSGLNSRLSR